MQQTARLSILLAAVFLAGSLPAAPAWADKSELRILFLANYLFHHQNPYYSCLKGMLAEGSMKQPVLTHVVGELHGSFMDHANHHLGLDWISGHPKLDKRKQAKHIAAFAEAKPDIVVVQIYLNSEWGKKEADHTKFVEALHEYKSACDANGARLIICPAPGLQFRPLVIPDGQSAEDWDKALKSELDIVTHHMVHCSAELGIDVAPMPMAFAQFYAANPEIDLHQAGDIYHLSTKDSYLSAVCLALTILGHRSEPLPPAAGLLEQFNRWGATQTKARKAKDASAKTIPAMSETELKAIHAAAWAAVSDFRDMLKAIADKDAAAAKRAGELAERGKAGVPGLADAVLNADKYLARNAARVLGPLGAAATHARVPLIRVLAGKDPRLADLAEESLAEIAAASPDTVTALQRASADRNAVRAVRAAGALANAGPQHEATAAKALIAHMGNTSETVVKKSIFRAVALAQKTEAGPVLDSLVTGLVATLKHPSPAIRSRAAKALGTLGPAAAAAVPVLQEGILTGASYKADAIEAMKKIRPGKKVSTTPGLDIGDEDDDLEL